MPILELGAGDGSLMLRLAKQRKGQWPQVAVTLLDRRRVSTR
jgi:cyclopropane fatty-acyl-phospholipid synthase-like methyltransferase